MTSLEWDETICDETTSIPEKPYSRLSDRAKQERQKKMRAFLAVRQPQKKLDPRILELAMNRTLDDHDEELPYLHFGLKVSPESFEPYIKRNGIKVALRDTPDYNEELDMLFVFNAIEKHLQMKGGLRIESVFALEERNDQILLALDNTETLHHQKFRVWKKYAKEAVQVIRDELGLGDQKAMWWWDSQYGEGYTSPIPDYNPPQINPKPSVVKPRKRIHFDFDIYDSENGEETE